jgi:hypothetical protein
MEEEKRVILEVDAPPYLTRTAIWGAVLRAARPLEAHGWHVDERCLQLLQIAIRHCQARGRVKCAVRLVRHTADAHP